MICVDDVSRGISKSSYITSTLLCTPELSHTSCVEAKMSWLTGEFDGAAVDGAVRVAL